MSGVRYTVTTRADGTPERVEARVRVDYNAIPFLKVVAKKRSGVCSYEPADLWYDIDNDGQSIIVSALTICTPDTLEAVKARLLGIAVAAYIHASGLAKLTERLREIKKALGDKAPF